MTFALLILPTAHCPLPTADCRLPTAHCCMPTADCPMLYAHFRRNRRDAFPHGGFTLLEVLIAVFVAATALLAIWKLHGQVVSMVPDMRFQSVAPFLAEKTLAEIDAMPREKHASGHCEAEDQQPGISCGIQIEWMDDKRWEKIGTSVEKIDILVTGPAEADRFLLRAYRFYPINKGKTAAPVPPK